MQSHHGVFANNEPFLNAIMTAVTQYMAKVLFHLLYCCFQSDGSQYDTLIEQLAAYSDDDMTIFVNNHTYYREPIQTNLGKY